MTDPGHVAAAWTSRPAEPRLRSTRRGGFTLIELMAVALLMALVAAIAIPNMGFRAAQQGLDEAESMAALFEFGRQRAVMTGLPQQVVIDLDQQRYWLEVQRRTEREIPTGPVRWSDERELALTAPRDERARFTRALGAAGRGYTPPRGVWIAAIDTAEGRLEAGTVTLPFAGDGSTEGTVIWVSADGGHQLRLEIAPLADRIRIEHVES